MRCVRYELPLARPLQLGSRRVSVRCGWLVRDGDRVGDACPLPEFSPDSLPAVDAALRGEGEPTESLGWALHSLRFEGAARVRTAGLVVAAAAGDLPDLNHGCVKLKVGREPLAVECAAIERFVAAGVRLRLDGNRSLSLETTQRLADAAGGALEFFEEPVPAALLEAAMQQVPVGLDETLAVGGPVPAGAAAFVLKPTVLGDRRTLELVEQATGSAIPVVVSSSYESAVGRAALIRFAAAVAPDVAHGLGTGPAFARDFTGWVEERGDTLEAGQGQLPGEDEWARC